MTAISHSKKKLRKKPILPLITAWIFTIIGGYLSVYAYIMLDGMYANMQTGNLLKSVLFAIQGKKFSHLLFSVFMYAVGIATAVLLRKLRFGNIVSVCMEIVAIGICVFFATNGENNKLPLNFLISFSCALQFEFFNKVGTSGFTSVMCTNNVRFFVQNIVLAIIEKNGEKALIGLYYLSFVLFFLSGVAIGAVMVNAFSYNAVGFVIIPLAIILALQIVYSLSKKAN